MTLCSARPSHGRGVLLLPRVKPAVRHVQDPTQNLHRIVGLRLHEAILQDGSLAKKATVVFRMSRSCRKPGFVVRYSSAPSSHVVKRTGRALSASASAGSLSAPFSPDAGFTQVARTAGRTSSLGRFLPASTRISHTTAGGAFAGSPHSAPFSPDAGFTQVARTAGRTSSLGRSLPASTRISCSPAGHAATRRAATSTASTGLGQNYRTGIA